MKKNIFNSVIFLIIISLFLPNICISETKTVTGEDCVIVTGDMENIEWNSERDYLRYRSVFNGLSKIRQIEFLRQKDHFDFFNDVQKYYLENFKVISHIEKGRKICEKVQFSIDTDVLQEVINLHSGNSQMLPDSKVWEDFLRNKYYNKTNLSKSSNIISVWTYDIVDDDFRNKKIESEKKNDLEKSKRYENYDHFLGLWEINCKKKLFRGKEFVDYDNEGKSINNLQVENSKWERIIPGTSMEVLYRKVCVTTKEQLKKK